MPTNRMSPKEVAKLKIIPITKPGKEKVKEASKFRPISLINVGGKVLEKLLIKRITHYIYSNNQLNTNQYGFTHKKDRPEMTIWHMRIAYWIPKATNTNSEYATFIAFLRQQWLRERAPMLRHCLSCYLMYPVS